MEDCLEIRSINCYQPTVLNNQIYFLNHDAKYPVKDRAPIMQTKRGVAGLKGKKKALHKLQNWLSQKRFDKKIFKNFSKRRA